MNEKPDFEVVKKPDRMPMAQWEDYKANGLGPCQVLTGLDYCGQPAYSIFTDVKEITKPSDKVIRYKTLGMNYFCQDHMRERIYINADGTVTFGQSSFELQVVEDA